MGAFTIEDLGVCLLFLEVLRPLAGMTGSWAESCVREHEDVLKKRSGARSETMCEMNGFQYCRRHGMQGGKRKG